MMASNSRVVFFVICCATVVVGSTQDNGKSTGCLHCTAFISYFIGEYSLTNLPTEDSSLVAEASGFDTTLLKDTYHDLGKGAKMGFYAAAAHETEFKDKALSIHGDVSSLQDSSISAFQKFEETSKKALKNLEVAFEHISDSEGGKAHELLDEVGRQANDLAKEAKDIELQAGAGRDKVSSLLEEIYSSRGEREKEKAIIEAQERDLQAQKAHTETDLRNAQAAAAESQRQADQARQDADHEKRKKKKKCKGWKKLKCKLAKAVNWNLVGKYEKREKSLRQEAERHSARAREQQQNAARASSQLQQLANKLSEARQKIMSIEKTAQGLQDIISNYNGLTVTLQSVSTAWEDVSNNCVDLNKRVTNGATVSTPLFQKQAVTLYVQWLSLSKASKYFLNEVKPIEAIDAQSKMKKDEL